MPSKPSHPSRAPSALIAEFAPAPGVAYWHPGGIRHGILDQLGQEHPRTGSWIVYTSADSVFRWRDEETGALPNRTSRAIARMLTGEHAVSRVSATIRGNAVVIGRTPTGRT